jgi:hypothetical protein
VARLRHGLQNGNMQVITEQFTLPRAGWATDTEP